MTENETTRVSGTTDLYFQVGDPIRQVKAPQFINRIFNKNGIDAIVLPLQIPAALFEKVMPSVLQIANLKGIILTVPFKVKALDHVQRVLGIGQATQAINAMRRDSTGVWEGDMFDGVGLVRALSAHGIEVQGKSFLLVGAGGAGRAIAVSLAMKGARSIDINDIDQKRQVEVVASVASVNADCRVSAAPAQYSGHDIAINATPMGMREADPLPIVLDGIGSSSIVFDIVPTPAVTKLMEAAAVAGARAIGGQHMVQGQVDSLMDFFGYRDLVA